MKYLIALTILILSCSPTGMCFAPCSHVVDQIELQDGVFECEIMSQCASQWDSNFKPLNRCEINACAVEYFKQSLECRQYTSELMGCLQRNNCMTIDCARYVSLELEKLCK